MFVFDWQLLVTPWVSYQTHILPWQPWIIIICRHTELLLYIQMIFFGTTSEKYNQISMLSFIWANFYHIRIVSFRVLLFVICIHLRLWKAVIQQKKQSYCITMIDIWLKKWLFGFWTFKTKCKNNTDWKT